MWKISYKLAHESGQDQEILLYSLNLIKSSLMGYSLLFLTSYIFGVWRYALTAAVTASVFRIFSGGAHATSAIRCSIIGLTVFTGFGAFAGKIVDKGRLQAFLVYLLILLLFSFITLYRYAPADTPSKPINSQAQKKTLRLTSFILLASYSVLVLYVSRTSAGNLYINYIAASSLGLGWQMFTLTPWGYSFNHAFDSSLKNLMKGG